MSSAVSLRPAGQRRSQAERRDASERLLVEATKKIVVEQGVSAATFDEIGRVAGCSRGLATQRFGSKRGLTEALIAQLHAHREAIVELDHVAEMKAFDAIVHYVDGHFHDLRRHRGTQAYFMLLASAVADATSMRDLFAGSHEKVRVWLRGVLARGQASGEIRSDLDPDAVALMIGSLLLGASIQSLVDPTTDPEPIRAASVETLRRALCGPPAGT